MSVLFIDGFTHYGTASEKGWINANSMVPTASRGRWSGGSMYGTGYLTNFNNNTSFPAIEKLLPANQTTVFMGANVKGNRMDPGYKIFGLFDYGVGEQLDVRTNSSGQLYITRNGTQLGSTAALITALGATTWAFVEFAAFISPTAGWVEVRKDNALVASYYGPSGTNRGTANGNTRNTANSYVSALRLGYADNPGGGYGSSAAWDFSDLYVLNASGAVNNDFLNDIRVVTLMPDGTGTPGDAQSFGHTGAGVTSNYQAVDETLADQDTTYVHSSIVGQRDLYSYADLPANVAAVYALQFIPEARKDDSGSRTLGITVRSGGSEADLATTINLTGSYQMLPFVAEKNPVTSAAWTPVDVNAIESGPKVIA